MTLTKKFIKNTKINQKTMIRRREFQDKLTKELLKIVHFNSLKFVFERSQGCMYM